VRRRSEGLVRLAGADDPNDPASLHAELLRSGADLETAFLPGAAHGSCFVDPRFRIACVAFLGRVADT
jgi:hypothetical protein